MIVTLRRRRNLTQVELAERAGISRGHLAAIETGKRMPSLSVAARICEVLGIAMDPGLFLPRDVAARNTQTGGNPE